MAPSVWWARRRTVKSCQILPLPDSFPLRSGRNAVATLDICRDADRATLASRTADWADMARSVEQTFA